MIFPCFRPIICLPTAGVSVNRLFFFSADRPSVVDENIDLMTGGHFFCEGFDFIDIPHVKLIGNKRSAGFFNEPLCFIEAARVGCADNISACFGKRLGDALADSCARARDKSGFPFKRKI